MRLLSRAESPFFFPCPAPPVAECCRELLQVLLMTILVNFDDYVDLIVLLLAFVMCGVSLLLIV